VTAYWGCMDHADLDANTVIVDQPLRAPFLRFGGSVGACSPPRTPISCLRLLKHFAHRSKGL